MNDEYDTKVSNTSWFRKFIPQGSARNYAMFTNICIIIIVNIFIIYWRYIRPKWYKKHTKTYYNLKGSNTLILQTKKTKLRKNKHQSVIQTVICYFMEVVRRGRHLS